MVLREMVGFPWTQIAGLILDVIGAVVLTSGLLISKKQALELGVAKYAGDTDEENLALPAVRDRLRQARNAKIGLVFLVLGFLLQIVGTWPT